MRVWPNSGVIYLNTANGILWNYNKENFQFLDFHMCLEFEMHLIFCILFGQMYLNFA